MSRFGLEDAKESWAAWLVEFNEHLAPVFENNGIPKGLGLIAYLINRETNLLTDDHEDKEDWQK